MGAWAQFRFLTIPHLARPIAIVVMIQAIFHLSLYAEIEIVSRGNGNKNLPYLIGEFASNNIGAASATGTTGCCALLAASSQSSSSAPSVGRGAGSDGPAGAASSSSGSESE